MDFSKNFWLYFSALTFVILVTFLRVWLADAREQISKNQNLVFVATIKDEPANFDNRQLIKIADAKVWVDLFPRYRVGDRLKIDGFVDREGNIFGAKIEKLGSEPTLVGLMSIVRHKIAASIDKLMTIREATLVKGVVLGVDEIDRGFRDQLIETGTIHVVVVSGQNLSLVAGMFLVFVKYLGRRLSLFLASLAVMFYAALAGFEIPVVRACIMVILGSIAIYFGREKLAIWNLFLAAALIIFIWPKAIFEISFQLTFAATLGIMTLGRSLNRITNYKNPLRFRSGQAIIKIILGNAAVATSAYLFTAPIIYFHFGRLSLLAPLVNILVAEAVLPIMILGFLVAFLSLIWLPLAQLLAYVVFVPAFYFVKTVEIFSELI